MIADRGDCIIRHEATIQNYTGSCVQRWSSLNIKAADVEQWQIREYDIATSHVVGGSTVDGEFREV